MPRIVLPKFEVGVGDWERTLREACEAIAPGFWSNFRPWGMGDALLCQRLVGRRFPDEYAAFVRTFGSGLFPTGGNFYSALDVVAACHGPLLAVLGSSDWASDIEQLHFYATRGKYNPSPARFTEAAMKFSSTNLLDLLQVGIDGSCGYLQIGVSESQEKGIGFGVLHGSTLEFTSPTFSEGLRQFLQQQLD